MKKFMGDDFLLSTATAQKLYERYAAGVPIIDYHCHVSPKDIFDNRVYENITREWLSGDHYKWRLMRACGIAESCVTGDADDYTKFASFARCLPYTVGNPVYHWAHLELKRYFGIDIPLNGDSAKEIWDICNEKLRTELSARTIIKRSNVYGLATTDDPADTLEWHAKLAADPSFTTIVKPAWRPDKLMGIHKTGFAGYMEKLGSPSSFAALKNVLLARLDHFDAHGCTASDHGLEFVERVPATDGELDAILGKGLRGDKLTHNEVAAYQYALMLFLGGEYKKRGWVMEIHYGALRNVNTAQFRQLGADTGYDVIAPSVTMSGLPLLLDELNSADTLPKTVLFSLSPHDNAMLCALAAGFQKEGQRGYVQQGAAWWFNDTIQGITEQMRTFASMGVLGNFLGMVTDSRSFLSYTRHEYFRRLLCNLIGGWVENGEYPNDDAYLGELIENISFNNAKNFFGY